MDLGVWRAIDVAEMRFARSRDLDFDRAPYEELLRAAEYSKPSASELDCIKVVGT